MERRAGAANSRAGQQHAGHAIECSDALACDRQGEPDRVPVAREALLSARFDLTLSKRKQAQGRDVGHRGARFRCEDKLDPLSPAACRGAPAFERMGNRRTRACDCIAPARIALGASGISDDGQGQR